ncbi:MAG: hypothetical protein AUH30_15810 [Candidatus Rokubacteria bacterium 13_1_40CM_68_15]|nr:MAG: hypothetical protein AUH30_15810 [Candidatus Rokubacteria bacterium 13_1_40CM_68_15]
MMPRQHAEPDGVGVFLHRGGDHLLGCLVEAGVDDLDAGVAQRAGDDLGAAIVAIQPRLRDDDANLALGHGRVPRARALPAQSTGGGSGRGA